MLVRGSRQDAAKRDDGRDIPICEKIRYTLNNGEADLQPEKISSGLLCTRRRRSNFHRSGLVSSVRGISRRRTSWDRRFRRCFRQRGAVQTGVGAVVKPSAPRVQAILVDVLSSCGHRRIWCRSSPGLVKPGGASAGRRQDIFHRIGAEWSARAGRQRAEPDPGGAGTGRQRPAHQKATMPICRRRSPGRWLACSSARDKCAWPPSGSTSWMAFTIASSSAWCPAAQQLRQGDPLGGTGPTSTLAR